jgi:hypothetical protein
MFYSIIRWGLPHPRRVVRDGPGLAFDFLVDTHHADGSITPVVTGHAEGLITINTAEGDSAEREKRRTALGEPYRTLIGHFRHELGHYYWNVLVRDAGGSPLDAFRARFGDEDQDYAAALSSHYARQQSNALRPDWRQSFVSTYATAHPWEDFAETFAHYVHMIDALETAGSFGLRTVDVGTRATHTIHFDPYVEGSIGAIIDAWVPVTIALNAINRSMGQPDFYPFESSEKPAVQDKLAFVHDLVRACATTAPARIEPTVMPDAARA